MARATAQSLISYQSSALYILDPLSLALWAPSPCALLYIGPGTYFFEYDLLLHPRVTG